MDGKSIMLQHMRLAPLPWFRARSLRGSVCPFCSHGGTRQPACEASVEAARHLTNGLGWMRAILVHGTREVDLPPGKVRQGAQKRYGKERVAGDNNAGLDTATDHGGTSFG